MAKDKDPLPGAHPPDVRLKAFSELVAALEPLDRATRLDLLRAAANFYGLVVVMEQPR